MSWEDILKQPVEEEVSPETLDRRTIMGQTQGIGIGQFKDLTDEVLRLAGMARKDSSNQREILGQIRSLITDKGIQVVRA